MTLFVLFSLALGAATLALLLVRRPAPAGTADADVAAARPSRTLTLALVALVAAVAIVGYLRVGTPTMLAATPDATPGPGPALDAQVDTVQARAAQHPTDPNGWVQAAQMQTDAGHLDVATDDLRRTLALRPNDADLMAELADLIASQQRTLDGEPIQLVDRALAANPNQVKALALKGQYAMTQRDYRTMLASWNHALEVAPPNDPIAGFLRRRLESLRAAAMAASGAAAAAAPATR